MKKLQKWYRNKTFDVVLFIILFGVFSLIFSFFKVSEIQSELLSSNTIGVSPVASGTTTLTKNQLESQIDNLVSEIKNVSNPACSTSYLKVVQDYQKKIEGLQTECSKILDSTICQAEFLTLNREFTNIAQPYNISCKFTQITDLQKSYNELVDATYNTLEQKDATKEEYSAAEKDLAADSDAGLKKAEELLQDIKNTCDDKFKSGLFQQICDYVTSNYQKVTLQIALEATGHTGALNTSDGTTGTVTDDGSTKTVTSSSDSSEDSTGGGGPGLDGGGGESGGGGDGDATTSSDDTKKSAATTFTTKAEIEKAISDLSATYDTLCNSDCQGKVSVLTNQIETIDNTICDNDCRYTLLTKLNTTFEGKMGGTVDTTVYSSAFSQAFGTMSTEDGSTINILDITSSSQVPSPNGFASGIATSDEISKLKELAAKEKDAIATKLSTSSVEYDIAETTERHLIAALEIKKKEEECEKMKTDGATQDELDAKGCKNEATTPEENTDGTEAGGTTDTQVQPKTLFGSQKGLADCTLNDGSTASNGGVKCDTGIYASTCEIFDLTVRSLETTGANKSLGGYTCTEFLDPIPLVVIKNTPNSYCIQATRTLSVLGIPDIEGIGTGSGSPGLSLTYTLYDKISSAPQGEFCNAIAQPSGGFQAVFALVTFIYGWIQPLLVAAAVIMIAITGGRIMFAEGGGQEQLKDAYKTLIQVLVGLILLFTIKIFLISINNIFFVITG